MPLPPAARAYLWLTVAGAGGLLAALTVWHPAPPRAAGVLVLGELAGLAVVAQHFPLAFGPKRKFDLSLAVHFAIVLVAGMPLAMALVGAGVGLGQATLALRRDPHSGRRMRGLNGALFNTSQAMLAVAAAGLAQGAAPDELAVLAVPAAAATLYLTNSVAVAGE